jgi:hypothetical protein
LGFVAFVLISALVPVIARADETSLLRRGQVANAPVESCATLVNKTVPQPKPLQLQQQRS